MKKEQALERAEGVRQAAGLSNSMGGLDTALNAMDKETEKAESASRSAELKIGAFGQKEITDDPNISAALEAAETPALPASSSRDRLATLRARKS